MTSARDLLTAIATSEPSRPRLTWYGKDGERVELSGRVLANTVVKATNLLVDADLGPGETLLLDLPLHWRAVTWAFAGWTAGAEVAVGGDDRADAVVVVSDRPERYPTRARTVVAVPLPALAMSYPGVLPPGAVDGAADLMTHPDALGPVPPLDLDGIALGPHTTHGQLVSQAEATLGHGPWPARPRVLAAAPELRTALTASLAIWARDGSVVLTAEPVSCPGSLCDQERVTATL